MATSNREIPDLCKTEVDNDCVSNSILIAGEALTNDLRLSSAPWSISSEEDSDPDSDETALIIAEVESSDTSIESVGRSPGGSVCSNLETKSPIVSESNTDVSISYKQSLASGTRSNKDVQLTKQSLVPVTAYDATHEKQQNPPSQKKMTSTEATPEYCNSIKTQHKPPYTYLSLIVAAIETSAERALTVPEIRNKLSTWFPFFTQERTAWKEGVRSSLVKGKCFYKTKMFGNKMSKWKVDCNLISPEIFLRQNNQPYSYLHADTLPKELGIELSILENTESRNMKMKDGVSKTTQTTNCGMIPLQLAKTAQNVDAMATNVTEETSNDYSIENLTPLTRRAVSPSSVRAENNISLPWKLLCQSKPHETVSLRTFESDDFLGASKHVTDTCDKGSNHRRLEDNNLHGMRMPFTLTNTNGTGAKKRGLLTETTGQKRQKIMHTSQFEEPKHAPEIFTGSTANTKHSAITNSAVPQHYNGNFGAMVYEQRIPETIHCNGDMYIRYPMSQNTLRYDSSTNPDNKDLNDPNQYSISTNQYEQSLWNLYQYNCQSGIPSYGLQNTYTHELYFPCSYDYSASHEIPTSSHQQWPSFPQVPSPHNFGYLNYPTMESWTNHGCQYPQPNSTSWFQFDTDLKETSSRRPSL